MYCKDRTRVQIPYNHHFDDWATIFLFFILENLSLSLYLFLGPPCLLHIRRKTKTQIVASKTLNLNTTTNFDAKQTKLIFPNSNLNLASDALKFIQIF